MNDQTYATLENGALILKDGKMFFGRDPEKPLYPKYATVNERYNRHERRVLKAKLEAAQTRVRKAKGR